MVNAPLQAAPQTSAKPPLSAVAVDFRDDLRIYLTEMMNNAAALPGNNQNVVVSLQESLNLLDQLTETELQQMKSAFDRNPAAWEVNQGMNTLIEHQNLVQERKTAYLQKQAAKANQSSMINNTEVANLDYSDEYDSGCPWSVGIAPVITFGVITMALKGVNDAINDGLVVVILGSGTTVPNPIKIITSVAFFISKLTLTSMEWDRQITSECETDTHYSYLRDVVVRTQAKFTAKKEMKITTDYVKQIVDKGQIKYTFVVYATEDGKRTTLTLDDITGATHNDPFTFTSFTSNNVSFTPVSPAADGIYQLTVNETGNHKGLSRLRFTTHHDEMGVTHYGVGTAKVGN